MKKTKTRTKINCTLFLCILMAIIAVSSTFAYFIDRATVTNRFTVGDIKVELTEPNWDEENAKLITPNKTMTKDPKVTNTGHNDEFVFLKVVVPRADIKTASDDGTAIESKVQDLFSYDVNENWKLVKEDVTDTESIYYYAYQGADDSMKVLVPNASTNTLFDSVKFVNAIEGQGLEGKDLAIDIDVMAIQTTDLGVTSPSEILNILLNQSK